MNGDDAWRRFEARADKPLLLRSRRLNVKFKGSKEPALDGIEHIEDMMEEAIEYPFHVRERTHDPGAIIPYVKDGILEVALRLRAGLFFLVPDCINYNEDQTIALFRGTICSRLGPDHEALRKLIQLTKEFVVRGTSVKIPTAEVGAPFKVPVEFQQEVAAAEDLIQIYAKFRTGSYLVPISGCPVSLKVSLLRYVSCKTV
jgi:hypothetical protein